MEEASAEEAFSTTPEDDVPSPRPAAEIRTEADVDLTAEPDLHLPQLVGEVPEAKVEVPIGHFEITESEYPTYDVDATVDKVLRRSSISGDEVFKVRLRSGHHDEISRFDLEHLPQGQDALFDFEEAEEDALLSDDPSAINLRRSSRAAVHKRARLLDLTPSESGDEDSMSSEGRKRIKLIVKQPKRAAYHQDRESDSDDIFSRPSQGVRKPRSQNFRSSTVNRLPYTESEDDISTDSSSENFIDSLHKSKRTQRRGPGRPPGRKRKAHPEPSRRSERRVYRESMRERLEDDIPAIDGETAPRPRVVGAKEHFEQRPATDEFRHRHLQDCMMCGNMKETPETGPLVFCQGCTDSYHSTCLGLRATREHLVTKIGLEEFVLQCRRCIDAATKKDPTAPRFSKCQVCGEVGVGTKPFRTRKTPKEEQKEREENGGRDPVTTVATELLFNEKNLLFRCVTCHRGWHMHHLPAREESLFEPDDQDELGMKRWAEYCADFSCEECRSMPSGIGGVIAWRPTDPENYIVGTGPEDIPDDEKDYLIKWSGKSHFVSCWMPGSWVWSMVTKPMLLAFIRRNGGKVPPIMRTEDAIPEENLRVDIVFSIQYNNIVSEHIEEVDLARIKEVERALVKFKGLGYEDVVWEKPPHPTQEPERWEDFKVAYDDWVRGNYINLPPSSTLNQNLKRVRALPFEEKVLLKEQPTALKGGKLMEYQLDGLNWLYYQWHRGQNAILADEMGLGKTIQVIGFLLTLQTKHHCWPALVVVPNSTCENWKREIRHWAPSLRVVTYFGGAKAMDLTEKYQLFRDHRKNPSCHIVVTSYDAAQGPALAALRRVPWQALVVDEGQRLKNDAGLLYKALSTLKTPFKLLLTGTPLQNRQRELFNLLQFLDPSKDAESLEATYEELTKENITELHNMLRPFFLRRTKAQVLDFLPTMAQIIVPISMSALQRELYKSILAKNAELLRSVFGGEKRGPAKGGLRNILMQLRKCLCHPFVYNLEIEERSVEAAVTHRRLVEASAKLQILELMLPKLRERGHRVLIFSQFLDMLTIMEDFLGDLGLEHIRLDGSMGSLEKQKCIDNFNAEDSKVFAFLLSTRAGGVGINLATADTVIILDPDFNPHQDIQAISRAHRIGQQRKVLVFQLMTRASAEEKIMQIGKKKMALDHALIDSMEAEEEDAEDVEAVLRFGAEALFKDDGSSDIRYDSSSVDNLLDRSQVEKTKTNNKNSVESQFSFARVWQNESATMVEGVGASDDEPLNTSVWDQILAERTRRAQAEAAQKAARLGRGKRQRKDVDYQNQIDALLADESPMKRGSDMDTDFQAVNESEDDDEGVDVNEVSAERRELGAPLPQVQTPQSVRKTKPTSPVYQKSPFKRVPTPVETKQLPPAGARECLACGKKHVTGSCPVKLAGYEFCGLCGLAHYGWKRTCPHLNSETQVRLMLQALDQSPEPKELVLEAKKKLRELKANLVSAKKAKEKNAVGVAAGQPVNSTAQTATSNGNGRPSCPPPSPSQTLQSQPPLQRGATATAMPPQQSQQQHIQQHPPPPVQQQHPQQYQYQRQHQQQMQWQPQPQYHQQDVRTYQTYHGGHPQGSAPPQPGPQWPLPGAMMPPQLQAPFDRSLGAPVPGRPVPYPQPQQQQQQQQQPQQQSQQSKRPAGRPKGGRTEEWVAQQQQGAVNNVQTYHPIMRDLADARNR